ncbi:PREDICTED: transposon [Prunus dulcis]|uniref:PREDICTED: transposon n=1 Tax=Prunus dulcis TaxID=3755 RepID=A0A5E4GBP9_PRUDU|nr:PREDICTED: transposon [Prunus dulcis]
MPKGEDFRPEFDMANRGFKIGLTFATAELFRKAVRIYSINCRRELIFMNNDCNKIRVVCEEGCPFVIHASSVSGSTYLEVKTFNPTHVCSKGTKNIHATASWLAKRYSGQLRLNPNWTASSFAEQVHQDYDYRPSRATVYRARAMVVDIVEGSYSKQYEVLWDSCHELRTRNVGSTIIIKYEMEGDRPQFQRIYIYLAACKKGFLDGCRPVVCLDGCHVKGPHRPVRSAMGVDANNGMFPLAYAYVEIESNSTWLWFLELLSGDLNKKG